MTQNSSNFFNGRYYHTLGPKGRVSLPKAFRSHFDKAIGIITVGLDQSLFLFPNIYWQKMIDNLKNLPFTQKKQRDWIRFLTNNAADVKPDSLGRISIPEFLRNYADLKKNVVVVGSLDRIEIWNQTTYQEYSQSLLNNAQEIAESIEVNK